MFVVDYWALRGHPLFPKHHSTFAQQSVTPKVNAQCFEVHAPHSEAKNKKCQWSNIFILWKSTEIEVGPVAVSVKRCFTSHVLLRDEV